MPNLVGLGNEQVPTNAMLGGLAYQDSVGEINIDKIKARVSDTATDIFVYDTRKDSDGGAWRHRTQNTSWYNEGASETRGARKEFPAVAVIVAEQNFITIYDGDDPNLSMWMVFNTIAGGNSQGMADRPMIQLQNVDKVVHMLNGILVTGTKNEGSNYGQPVINFISEKVLRMDSQPGEGGEWMGNIAQRNDAIGYRHVTYDYVITASHVNDVAMTVLPNARIDESTGLPIPTIAAGTEGGLSIITDDGNVYDHTGFSPVTSTNMGGDTVVVALGRASTVNFLYKTNLPSADESFDTKITAGSGNFYMNSNSGTTPLLRYLDDTVESFKQLDGTVYRGGSKGFDIITKTETVSNTVNNSLIAYIDTDYNTGYMIGDIKGAFLSDTSTTNITGSELVTNGTFDSNISSWSGGVQWTHTTNSVGGDTSGKLMVFHTASTNIYISQTITTVSGQYYIISYRASSDTADKARVWIGGTYYDYIVDNNNGAFVHHSHTFKASSTSTEIRLYTNGASRSYWDDISVRTAELDRSINQKDLQVFGTVTKSAVATGAELVAYSGWSSSNYFRQPYNSDLDFGTGDWSFNFWINPNDSSSGSVIMSRWSYNVNNSTAGRIGIYFNSGNVRFDLTDDGGSSYQAIAGSNGIQDTTGWHMVNILRRGSHAEMWVDGKLDVRTALTSTSNGSYSNSNAILEIGHSPNMGAPDSGIELALIRISKSAPTAEQIEKMYNDEKCLYHKNAKCTLHGTSDEVTGLAFDDTNNILHVGTSSGRSEFQGLNRINNTTTAVTTAISASNEFVAEQ